MADLVPTTWNPADKDSTVTLSGGDLTATSTGGGVRSVFGVTSGKYYWEVTVPDNVGQFVGVGTELNNIAAWPGSDTESWAYETTTGGIYFGGNQIIGPPPIYAGVSVISVLLDADDNFLQLWRDGNPIGGPGDISLASRTGSTLYAAFGYTGSATANFGDTPFVYTPPTDYQSGFGFDPDQVLPVPGVKVFTAGEPSVIRGPNQVSMVTGLAALKMGAPVVQLGYPETLLPTGSAVFSAGSPTVLPYSNKSAQVAGKSLFQAGFPTVAYNPIIGGTEFIVPAGVRVLSAGTPAMGAAATIEAQGAAVFSAGSPAAKTSIGVSGASLLTAGAPAIGAGVSPAGVALLRTGVPKLAATVSPAGKSVFRAGVPSLIAGDFVVQPSGAAVFSAGLPRISNTTIHPWGRTHLRTGTPKATRSATC